MNVNSKIVGDIGSGRSRARGRGRNVPAPTEPDADGGESEWAEVLQHEMKRLKLK